MPKFNSVNDVLDFAISQENDAHDFYMDLTQRVSNADLREVIKGFAIDELQHAIRLRAIKTGEAAFIQEEVGTLNVVEAKSDAGSSAVMNYADLLVAAMKREKAAFRLYTNLASIAKKEELRDTLLGLAREEAQHKLTLEIEYDWVAS